MIPSNNKAILCFCKDETTLRVRQLLLERFGYKVVPADSVNMMSAVLGQGCTDMLLMDDLDSAFDYNETARVAKRICPGMLAVVLTPEWRSGRGDDMIDGFLWLSGPREEWLSELQSLFEQRRVADTSSRSVQ